MGGVVIPPATRTALFVGRNGIGPFCYGNGTRGSNRAPGTSASGAERLCYDPTTSDKGVARLSVPLSDSGPTT